ncbi:P-loop containing nucleoside triphosphate hydrolase protein [Xylaria bambusicola]|uniref:P-loop containing nucleoside triphosphate hydrolase protein n=1 Tax=Xylaria bambusicola TaxID=326684 RepID=UPI002008A661|nr:P-loop containing nucleoside triphosphate hydrolase protein [Xylaria bambusicola]KAI0502736.1 P-loop containing nucleoside triphosphate hydrolase protein [Xylaria bambusicola]
MSINPRNCASASRSISPPSWSMINEFDIDEEASMTGESSVRNGELDTETAAIEGCNKSLASPPIGKRPENWTMAVSMGLKILVAEAKGMASKPVIKYIKRYLNGTKLIFVVGQSGTGKSTFLREISGMDLQIGKTRNSGTKNYEVCPAVIDGEQYLFIDTPGFGAADMDDMDCFCDIIACLEVLGPFVTVAGLIFVTGGNQERLTQQELKTIHWIKCFCGPQFYRYITIMTSKWDKISEDDFEEGWNSMLSMLEMNPSFAEILNPPVTSRHTSNHDFEGGRVYHHGIVVNKDHPSVPLNRLSLRHHGKERADIAVTMIRNHYKTAPGVKLQIIHEMGNNISWYNTEAAKVLKHNPNDIKLHVHNDILQVFARSEGHNLTDQSGHDSLQSAASTQNLTSQLPCAGVSKAGTQCCQPALDNQLKEAGEQNQPWLSKVGTWLRIARDVALFFFPRVAGRG